jgi:hypothetical protein
VGCLSRKADEKKKQTEVEGLMNDYGGVDPRTLLFFIDDLCPISMNQGFARISLD